MEMGCGHRPAGQGAAGGLRVGLRGEAPLSGEPPVPIDGPVLSCPTASLGTPHNQFYPWIEKRGHIGEAQFNTPIKEPVGASVTGDVGAANQPSGHCPCSGFAPLLRVTELQEPTPSSSPSPPPYAELPAQALSWCPGSLCVQLKPWSVFV